MKVEFTWVKNHWAHSDTKAALGWEQGVIVIAIWPDRVLLGSCREPLGSKPRDKIVDVWLIKNVKFIGREFVAKTFIDPDGTVLTGQNE